MGRTDVVLDGNCFGMSGQGWMISWLEVGNVHGLGS